MQVHIGLLTDTCMLNSKPVDSSMDQNVVFNDPSSPKLEDIKKYTSSIDKLIYLIVTRPKITFVLVQINVIGMLSIGF